MTTLSIRQVGSRGAKLLTFGGSVGRYAVSDGEAVLATGQFRTARSQLEIEAGGRRLGAKLKWNLDVPNELEVLENATGEKVIEGRRISGERQEQEWAMVLPTGATVSWIYRAEQDKLGFFNPDGGPVMQMGHDPSFDTSAKGGTLRVLFRFWGAAVASADRFLVQVEDGAVGQAVTREVLPILALLSMWLEKLAEADTSSLRGFA